MNTRKSIFRRICDAFNVLKQMRDECADLREQLAQERRAYAVVMERLRITQGRLVRATQKGVGV